MAFNEVPLNPSLPPSSKIKIPGLWRLISLGNRDTPPEVVSPLIPALTTK